MPREGKLLFPHCQALILMPQSPQYSTEICLPHPAVSLKLSRGGTSILKLFQRHQLSRHIRSMGATKDGAPTRVFQGNLLIARTLPLTGGIQEVSDKSAKKWRQRLFNLTMQSKSNSFSPNYLFHLARRCQIVCKCAENSRRSSQQAAARTGFGSSQLDKLQAESGKLDDDRPVSTDPARSRSRYQNFGSFAQLYFAIGVRIIEDSCGI